MDLHRTFRLVVAGGTKGRNRINSVVELRNLIGKMKQDSHMPAEYLFAETIARGEDYAFSFLQLRDGYDGPGADLTSFLERHGFVRTSGQTVQTYEIPVSKIFRRVFSGHEVVGQTATRV